jgi:hypothetical protein
LNQASLVPFGTDATRLAGYAMAANERLGAVDFVFENTGNVAAYIVVKQYVSATTTPSGYADVTPLNTVGAAFTVAAKGVLTKSYNLISKQIGFFGSGIAAVVNGLTVKTTTVNISSVLRNKSDLRGAQIDIQQVGRTGWGLDPAFNGPNLTRHWGTLDPVTGALDPNAPNYNQPADS